MLLQGRLATDGFVRQLTGRPDAAVPDLHLGSSRSPLGVYEGLRVAGIVNLLLL